MIKYAKHTQPLFLVLSLSFLLPTELSWISAIVLEFWMNDMRGLFRSTLEPNDFSIPKINFVKHHKISTSKSWAVPVSESIFVFGIILVSIPVVYIVLHHVVSKHLTKHCLIEFIYAYTFACCHICCLALYGLAYGFQAYSKMANYFLFSFCFSFSCVLM